MLNNIFLSLLFICLLPFGNAYSLEQTALKVEPLLEEFSNLPGASGFENKVRQHFVHYLKKLNQPYKIDKLGNVVTHIKGKKATKKILVTAHMDEIGFLIQSIDDNGFINVVPLGGWLTHVLWNEPWLIQTSQQLIPAISGMDPLHVLSDFTKPPKVTLSQFFLDTGFSKKALIKKGLRPGLPVTPDVSFKRLANGKYYLGKAFDDRAAIALMLILIDKIKGDIKPYETLDIIFAATVQEEVGMRGAKILNQALHPEVVLNLEAGIAHDYPQQFSKLDSPKLNGGPSLFVYDKSMLPSQGLLNFIYKTAQKYHIPTQWELEYSYGQDGASIQTSGEGAKAINIGLPVRYAHSHYGLISKQDLLDTKRLLLFSLQELAQLKKPDDFDKL